MQVLVTSGTLVIGPGHFEGSLPAGHLPVRKANVLDSKVAARNFYRDVAVLAFPKPVNGAWRATRSST